jgi:menaquinone-specific isochorismate synthase
MLEIKESLQLQSLLEKTIRSLQESKEAYRIVSVTREIPVQAPLSLFQAAGKMKMQRFFWSSATNDLIMTGVGKAHLLQTKTKAIHALQDAWEDTLAHADIFNPFQLPGTGLTAMGGMAFDPLKEKTGLWGNFPDQEMVIPEFVLTKSENGCYLTCNVKVNGNDHGQQLATLLKHREEALLSGTESFDPIPSVLSKKEIAPDLWKKSVSAATEAIQRGEAKKIVLARELRLTFSATADIGSIIMKLRATQPNSYVFAADQGEDCFVGATPERLVKLDEGKLLSTCLAGTAPRGKNKQEDDAIGKALLEDPKNRHEHDFVVQMIKEAIEPYAKNLLLPNEPVLYKLKNLQHLYTPVTADLNSSQGIFPIVEKLHPTPALGGTPKETSLRFIREHELLDRGWYGAPVGWLDGQNNGEFAVAIRSGLIQGDRASLFAGCGVVADSVPEEEYIETKIKFMPMLHAMDGEHK